MRPSPRRPRLRLRPARPADAPRCAAVMRAAVAALALRRPPPHPAAALAAWGSLPPLYHRWAMGPGGERYLLAVSPSGRLLGYAARRGAELTAVFVRPAAQGRGVGRALVEALCAELRREGRGAVRVLAARAAVPFYAALGFTGWRTVGVPLPGGMALAAVALRRRLSLRPARATTSRTPGPPGALRSRSRPLA